MRRLLKLAALSPLAAYGAHGQPDIGFTTD